MFVTFKWFTHIITFFSDIELAATIVEDLFYNYQEDVKRYGPQKARFRQIFRVFPIIIPIYADYLRGNFNMIKNYFKIAIRNIRKHKNYTIINISGLAIGMLCAMLIMLWVQDEHSYDRFHENANRIVRVTRRWLNQDGAVSLHLGHVAPPICPLLKNDFPEIEHGIRLFEMGSILTKYQDNTHQVNNCFAAEEDFFKIFSFDLLSGDSETCLTNPSSIVLTESVAHRYFGKENPMGKTVNLDLGTQKVDFTVTGIMLDMPKQSHFHAHLLISFKTLQAAFGAEAFEDWGSNNFGTYILLEEGYAIKKLQGQMDNFIGRHLREPQPSSTELVLQNLTDIHLHSNLDSEYEANGNHGNVIIFTAIAIFILFLACINFMNLATARSASRAKEVGLRKVVGAQKWQIIRQFLNEAIFLSFAAFLISMLSLLLVLPAFNQYIGKDLSFNVLTNPIMTLGMIGIALSVGLLSGSYPAFYLSSLKPIVVLRSTSKAKSGKFSLRTLLVIFQFTISLVLLVSVGGVNGQLNFMHNKKLGVDESHVVILSSGDYVKNHGSEVKGQLLMHPGVESVSLAKRIPSGRLLDSSSASAIVNGEEAPINFRIALLRVDHDYIPTFKIQLLAGRNFQIDMPTDSTEAFILNASAIKRLGWTSPEDAIGQSFNYGMRRGRVIGVVEDFHFESMRKEIAPIVMLISKFQLNTTSIRIHGNTIPETLKFLEKKWVEFNPGYSFNYQFLDDRFDQLYQSERKLHSLFNIFAILSIFISCLGLLGLASYTVEQRIREIGIRKVLGASINGVIHLLVKELIGWIAIANVIAWPIAYFLMEKWLEGFAYRYRLTWTLFVQSGVMVLLVALLTVGFQTLKAATANPLDSLKYE